MNIPVFCECGKAVPCYFYCDGCRKVHGSPNCPCGKPIKGVRCKECPDCTNLEKHIIEDIIRGRYYRSTGIICPDGNCTIPTCRTCKKAEAPETFCPLCMRNECQSCADKCRNDVSKFKQGYLKGTETSSTVSYSGRPSHHNKKADEGKPKLFVESWEYKKGNVIKHQLIGFERKKGG